uniref:Uncharacterized protein n=1 Tax=Bionectria ochroleuca TaxID=29856 RepID=A0A8H7NJX8_BIOOC
MLQHHMGRDKRLSRSPQTNKPPPTLPQHTHSLPSRLSADRPPSCIHAWGPTLHAVLFRRKRQVPDLNRTAAAARPPPSPCPPSSTPTHTMRPTYLNNTHRSGSAPTLHQISSHLTKN